MAPLYVRRPAWGRGRAWDGPAPGRASMSAEPQPDELAGTEQPFVSHLVELRDRLIRCAIAVLVCAAVLFFYPGPAALYDMLAAPLVAHLPAGGTLIATNVIS